MSMITDAYRYRWQTLAGLFLMLAVCILLYVLLPQAGSLVDRHAQNRLQVEKINMAENWESELTAYSERSKELEAFFGKLMVQSPGGDDISAVLQQVVSGAEKAGVIIQRVTPMEKERRKEITVLPVAISVKGTFHQIAGFANELEASHRLARISGMRILVEDLSRSAAVSGEIQLEMLIVQTG